jgi:hypothetical protein
MRAHRPHGPNVLDPIEIEVDEPPEIAFDEDVRERESLPPTVDADKFCHIDCGDGRTAYCGHVHRGRLTCKPYNGEAVCPTCGLPTCPTCAVMSGLNLALIKG